MFSREGYKNRRKHLKAASRKDILLKFEGLIPKWSDIHVWILIEDTRLSFIAYIVQLHKRHGRIIELP